MTEVHFTDVRNFELWFGGADYATVYRYTDPMIEAACKDGMKQYDFIINNSRCVRGVTIAKVDR